MIIEAAAEPKAERDAYDALGILQKTLRTPQHMVVRGYNLHIEYDDALASVVIYVTPKLRTKYTFRLDAYRVSSAPGNRPWVTVKLRHDHENGSVTDTQNRMYTVPGDGRILPVLLKQLFNFISQNHDTPATAAAEPHIVAQKIVTSINNAIIDKTYTDGDVTVTFRMTSAGALLASVHVEGVEKPRAVFGISIDRDSVRVSGPRAPLGALPTFRLPLADVRKDPLRVLGRAIIEHAGTAVQAAAEPPKSSTDFDAVKRAFLALRTALLRKLQANKMNPVRIREDAFVHAVPSTPLPAIYVKITSDALKRRNAFYNIYLSEREQTLNINHAPTHGLHSPDLHIQNLPTEPKALLQRVLDIINQDQAQHGNRATAAAEPPATHTVAFQEVFKSVLRKLQGNTYHSIGEGILARATISDTIRLHHTAGGPDCLARYEPEGGVFVYLMTSVMDQSGDIPVGDIRKPSDLIRVLIQWYTAALQAYKHRIHAASEPQKSDDDQDYDERSAVQALLTSIPEQIVRLPFGLEIRILRVARQYNDPSVQMHVTQGMDTFIIELESRPGEITVRYDAKPLGACMFMRRIPVRKRMTPKEIITAVIKACGLLEGAKSVWGPMDEEHTREFADGFVDSLLQEPDTTHPKFDEDDGEPLLSENFTVEDFELPALQFIRRIARRFVGATRSRVRDYAAEHGEDHLPRFRDLGYLTHRRTIDSGSQTLTNANIPSTDNSYEFLDYLDDTAAAITGYQPIEAIVLDRKRGRLGFDAREMQHIHAATEPQAKEQTPEDAQKLLRTIQDYGISANSGIWSHDKSWSLHVPPNPGGYPQLQVYDHTAAKGGKNIGTLNLTLDRGSSRFNVWSHSIQGNRISFHVTMPAGTKTGQFSDGPRQLLQQVVDKFGAGFRRFQSEDSDAMAALRKQITDTHQPYQITVRGREFIFSGPLRGYELPKHDMCVVGFLGASTKHPQQVMYLGKHGLKYTLGVSLRRWGKNGWFQDNSTQIELPVVKETPEELAVRVAEAALSDLAPKLRARYEAEEKAEQEARKRWEEDD